jgi:organic hydroperoxide reductase OsmC/OhrA
VAVTCTVKMGRAAHGGFAFEFEIDAELPGLSRADAEALVEQAHQVCPYSRAFRLGAATTARAKA